MNIAQDESGTRLTFSGDMNIYHVDTLKKMLLDNISQVDGSVWLDLSEVLTIDTAGAQFLLFIKQLFNNKQQDVFIKASNKIVDDALKIINVAKYFGMEENL